MSIELQARIERAYLVTCRENRRRKTGLFENSHGSVGDYTSEWIEVSIPSTEPIMGLHLRTTGKAYEWSGSALMVERYVVSSYAKHQRTKLITENKANNAKAGSNADFSNRQKPDLTER